jgi:hypothetical protein
MIAIFRHGYMEESYLQYIEENTITDPSTIPSEVLAVILLVKAGELP